MKTRHLQSADIMETLETALAERGELCLPASGFSMGPKPGGAQGLVIQSTAGQPPPFGSIVVFRRNGQWVAHRLVRRIRRNGQTLCITKGDALGCTDSPPVPEKRIVGIMTGYTSQDTFHTLNRPFQRCRDWLLSVCRLRPGR
jgi:hypothetical protein